MTRSAKQMDPEPKPKPIRRPQHMNGTRVPGKEMLTCEECKRRRVDCDGVWRFHSQRNGYLLQCKTCRLGKRACSFSRFEEGDDDEGEKEKNPRRGSGTVRGKKRRREESPIEISDSGESENDRKVAGSSSSGPKKVKLEDKSGLKVKSEKDWDVLEETLLAARKRRVEVQTKAEIEMAKVDAIIEEAERKVKG